MSTSRLRRRYPAWLCIQLAQGRFIFGLFLIVLLIVLFLGFAGIVQSQLSSVGAGHTELAYSLASVRNGASLRPIGDEGHFTKSTTADAELQNYFYLDPVSGALALRDGLKSLSPQMNPLSSFPVQIAQAPERKSRWGRNRSYPTHLVSLYLHLESCDEYLGHFFPEAQAWTKADRVLRCTQLPPVVKQPSTLSTVREWIKLKATSLLPTQRAAYLSDADLILKKPETPNRGKDGHSFEWAPASPRVLGGDIPVWRIFLLQDKAIPGLQIFPVADSVADAVKQTNSGSHASATPGESASSGANLSAESGEESQQGAAFRILDQVFLTILLLRYPVLIILGILLPLMAWIIGRRDSVVRRCLEPYLLLLLAQAITLLVAEALMGEGLAIWVGAVYTLLRLVQLVGFLWVIGATDQHPRRLVDLRPRPWLRALLQFELFLWSINALGLVWHIFGVFRDFSYISPA